MSNRPEHIFIHLGDGTCYVQRCEPLVATDDPLAEYEMCILHLHKKLTQAQEENKRLRAAIGLIWSLYVRKEIHLGLERFSGYEQDCIACICALALGQSMDGYGGLTAEDFIKRREALKLEKP